MSAVRVTFLRGFAHPQNVCFRVVAQFFFTAAATRGSCSTPFWSRSTFRVNLERRDTYGLVEGAQHLPQLRGRERASERSLPGLDKLQVTRRRVTASGGAALALKFGFC